MRSVLLAVAVTACTPRAITPPARTFVPDTSQLPATGADLSLGLGAGGSSDIFGPGGSLYSGRARQMVAKDLAIEAEGGVIAVNGGDSGYRDTNGYTGRIGIIKSYDPSFAVIAGIGGGLSSVAGNWGAADAGFIVSGTNRWVRPTLAFTFGYAAPTGNKTFEVSSDEESTTLQLPRNAYARLDLGLEIGPRGCFLIGMSYMNFIEYTADVVGADSHGDQTFLAMGLGARIPL